MNALEQQNWIERLIRENAALERVMDRQTGLLAAKDAEIARLTAHLAELEEYSMPAQEQADHERYSMCVDQPAQIDCRLTKCIFHRDGACNNVSPAITLRPDGYSCWSIKVREDAKEQADEHPGGIKIVEGPESLVDTFLKRLGMKGPVSCTAETAQRIAEAAGMTMQEAGESLTHDEHPAKKGWVNFSMFPYQWLPQSPEGVVWAYASHYWNEWQSQIIAAYDRYAAQQTRPVDEHPAKKGWVNITVPGLEWLPEKKYANSQAWIEASILEDFDVVLAAYDRYMQEGGQAQ